jgi:hypothetical protein
LGGDPCGLAPPPGAVRRAAFRLPDGSLAARYELAGDVPAAAAHYSRALRHAGFHLLGDASPGPWRWLTFRHRRTRAAAAVGLRQNRADEKMIRIVIKITPPAQPAGPRK